MTFSLLFSATSALKEKKEERRERTLYILIIIAPDPISLSKEFRSFKVTLVLTHCCPLEFKCVSVKVEVLLT